MAFVLLSSQYRNNLLRSHFLEVKTINGLLRELSKTTLSFNSPAPSSKVLQYAVCESSSSAAGTSALFLISIAQEHRSTALACNTLLTMLSIATAIRPPRFRDCARWSLTVEERRNDAVGEGPLHQLSEDEREPSDRPAKTKPTSHIRREDPILPSRRPSWTRD